MYRNSNMDDTIIVSLLSDYDNQNILDVISSDCNLDEFDLK